METTEPFSSRGYEPNDGPYVINESLLVNSTAASPLAPNCNLFGDDGQWKCDTLIIIRRTSATLSLVGGFGIILIIWLFRRYQCFSQRLIMDLNISVILVSIGYSMGGLYEDGPTCNFEAFCLTLSEWSVLIWISSLTFNIFMISVWGTNTQRYECAYHVMGWSVPLLISTVPLFGDNYGPAGAWCWIPYNYSSWRIGIWYAPFFSMVSLQCGAFLISTIATKRRLRRWQGTYNPELERTKQILKKEVDPLTGYPIVYIFTSVIPIINEIHDVLYPGCPIFALYCLDNFITPLLGCLNVIVFGIERENRARITWVQIKAAWQKNTNHQKVIREYPIMYRLDDKVCNGESQVIEFLRYDHVEYEKLQNDACKGQSCLEE